MSRVSEPLFYERGFNYAASCPYEKFDPRHRAEWLIYGADKSGFKSGGVSIYDRTPPNYKPRHRNTPPWEATPTSDALRDFIGGA